MALFVRSEALREVVRRLSVSNVRPSLCDFLIVKHALTQGDGTVTLSLQNETYMSSVQALAAVRADDDDAGLPPFFNPFGARREARNGWRTRKYPSNGPPDTVNGPGWKRVIEVLSEQPRRVRLTVDYLEHLPKVITTSEGPAPLIEDCAVWLHRARDLEATPGHGEERSTEELTTAFLAEVGLSQAEQVAIFRTGKVSLSFSSRPAEPRDYLPPPPRSEKELAETTLEPRSRVQDDLPLDADEPILREVRELLEVHGGVIFTGPPGTSKSWYARRIGWTLVEGDAKRITFLQFHPSYQYEDFVQGIVPRADGSGFSLVDKPFLRMCRAAEADPNQRYVIVIDELSRADPGRVFGEALTYVERSKRGLAFQLAMDGKIVRVPDNLVILATMNPFDGGVNEVDAAFERRFAKIAMEPDASLVERFLDRNGVDDRLRKRILAFFGKVNARARENPLAAIGHTFFIDVTGETSLARVWEHQLRFLFERAYRLNPTAFTEVKEDWQRICRDGSSRDVDAPSDGDDRSAS